MSPDSFRLSRQGITGAAGLAVGCGIGIAVVNLARIPWQFEGAVAALSYSFAHWSLWHFNNGNQFSAGEKTGGPGSWAVGLLLVYFAVGGFAIIGGFNAGRPLFALSMLLGIFVVSAWFISISLGRSHVNSRQIGGSTLANITSAMCFGMASGGLCFAALLLGVEREFHLAALVAGMAVLPSYCIIRCVKTKAE